MTVTNIKEAWRKADIIFPTDYLIDSECTAKAGYNIYWSTLEGCTVWISDLGNRLEVNLPDGKQLIFGSRAASSKSIKLLMRSLLFPIPFTRLTTR